MLWLYTKYSLYGYHAIHKWQPEEFKSHCRAHHLQCTAILSLFSRIPRECLEKFLSVDRNLSGSGVACVSVLSRSVCRSLSAVLPMKPQWRYSIHTSSTVNTTIQSRSDEFRQCSNYGDPRGPGQGRRHVFESGGTNSASETSRKFFDSHFLASGGQDIA